MFSRCWHYPVSWSTVGWGIVDGLIELVDSFVRVGIITTKDDVYVSGIDVLYIDLLEDSFMLPSKRDEGDDLEVATDERVGTLR